MRMRDLQPGTRIKNGGSVFVIRQCNLFVDSKGSLLGGAVFPEREDEGFCRGFSALAVLWNGRVTKQRVTVR
jgi:hypothetical protein